MQQPAIFNTPKAILVRIGDLSPVNQLGGTTPPEFGEEAAENFYVSGIPSSVTPVSGVTNYYVNNPGPVTPTPAFTHQDVGAISANAYDEIVVDVKPVVQPYNNVTTNTNPEIYRQIQLANKPFWLIVNCTGYGVAYYQNRINALALAQQIVNLLWADVNAFMLNSLFKGFAFVQPDLNVVFPDNSAIDRTFQSSLVQYAHACYRGAMFITTRPNDAVTMIAPKIAYNPNSGLGLAWPIIGATPAYEDRILGLYPNPIVDTPNISTMVAHVTSMYIARARDSGFPLNLNFGYILPLDPTKFIADGGGGVSANPAGADAVLARVIRFLSASGIGFVGLQSGPTGALIPVPQTMFPSSADVNVSGGSNIWAASGKVYVQYFDLSNNTVLRTFDQAFNEL